jgi:translation initiation factor 1 (eIF-1/SUI1)
MRAEHLVAVMLQTGRAKDYARIIQFLEEEAVELASLAKVLAQHGLTERWDDLKRKFDL